MARNRRLSHASTAQLLPLARLKQLQLVVSVAQGKHRYYRLHGSDIAAALEALSIVAGASCKPFVPATPPRLRFARNLLRPLHGGVTGEFRFTIA